MKLFKEIIICLFIFTLLIFAGCGMSILLDVKYDSVWITRWIPSIIIGFSFNPLCSRFAEEKSIWITIAFLGTLILGIYLGSMVK